MALIRDKKIEMYWFILLNSSTLLRYLLPNRKTLLSMQDGRTVSEHFKSLFSKLFKPFFLNLIKKVSMISTISAYIANDLKKYVESKKVFIIPNGVDIKSFSIDISLDEKLNIRSRYGLQDNDIVIITVSRLVPSRGIEDAIASLAYLPDEYKLLVLGKGESKNNLITFAIEKKVSNRVVFGNFVSHDKLPNILKTCDVFVRVSRIEGMGNSFVEALATGLPIVGTRIGGIPDFLIDGETGFFCEIGDPQSVASSIILAVEKSDYLAVNGMKLVREGYDWDNIAKSIQNLYFLLG